ncbi:hypothetical protein H0H87_011056 [Tephrocybe sp. NHM501043]|nr:hypothetical protein H0H87_011056 [Tephrocybe sp. NHM501043]
MEDMPIEVPEDTTERRPNLRGWWDYIPDKVASPTTQESAAQKQTPLHKALSKMTRLLNRGSSSSQYTCEKARTLQSKEKQQPNTVSMAARGTSPAPTTGSRLYKLVPSIHLFQKVVKDEKSRESQKSFLSTPRYRQGSEKDDDNPFSDSRQLEITRSFWGSDFSASIEQPSHNPFDDHSHDPDPDPFADASSRSSRNSLMDLKGYSETSLLGRTSLPADEDERRKEEKTPS